MLPPQQQMTVTDSSPPQQNLMWCLTLLSLMIIFYHPLRYNPTAAAVMQCLASAKGPKQIHKAPQVFDEDAVLSVRREKAPMGATWPRTSAILSILLYNTNQQQEPTVPTVQQLEMVARIHAVLASNCMLHQGVITGTTADRMQYYNSSHAEISLQPHSSD
jgi:hypothetical protein